MHQHGHGILIRDSDNEEVRIAFLSHEPESLVKSYHLIRAIERNLVTAYGFAELNEAVDNPVKKRILATSRSQKH